MRIVVLDGYTLNPGDQSWKPIEEMGDLTPPIADDSDRLILGTMAFALIRP